MTLNSEEKKRYFRQLVLPDFGEEAQKKLKQSSVFIAGAGGLGGPVATYLAAAGVGKLTICDRDVIELSNLNRQILHNTERIGLEKSESAFKTLHALNPDIEIACHNITIDETTIKEYAHGVDIIVSN